MRTSAEISIITNFGEAEASQPRERQMILEELFSLGEVAEFLGTSRNVPQRLVTERRIRFVRVGRLIRIPRSALDEYVSAWTVEVLVYKTRRAS